MTGFRQMQNLHAYSGGTVRDSHPVIYSLVALLPQPQALKRNIYLPIAYHFPKDLSITFKVRGGFSSFSNGRTRTQLDFGLCGTMQGNMTTKTNKKRLLVQFLKCCFVMFAKNCGCPKNNHPKKCCNWKSFMIKLKCYGFTSFTDDMWICLAFCFTQERLFAPRIRYASCNTNMARSLSIRSKTA